MFVDRDDLDTSIRPALIFGAGDYLGISSSWKDLSKSPRMVGLDLAKGGDPFLCKEVIAKSFPM